MQLIVTLTLLLLCFIYFCFDSFFSIWKLFLFLFYFSIFFFHIYEYYIHTYIHNLIQVLKKIFLLWFIFIFMLFTTTIGCLSLIIGWTLWRCCLMEYSSFVHGCLFFDAFVCMCLYAPCDCWKFKIPLQVPTEQYIEHETIIREKLLPLKKYAYR